MLASKQISRKIVHVAKTELSSSNIGSPQQDGMSGKMLRNYFENAR